MNTTIHKACTINNQHVYCHNINTLVLIFHNNGITAKIKITFSSNVTIIFLNLQTDPGHGTKC